MEFKRGVCTFAALLMMLASRCTQAQEFEGELTTYTLGAPSSGNCNFMNAPSAASTNYAAINAEQWESTKACGRCAEVSCADSRCSDTTKTELVYILDQCPECKKGDLDVSPSVFKSLTGSEPSRYKIKWRFVNCPVTGNIKYCLKDGSNPFYTAIQPTNIASGVKDMKINSKETGMVTSAYYYLLENAKLDLGSVEVAITSVDGDVITETLALTAGSCTDGKKQFTSAATPGTPPTAPAQTPAKTPESIPPPTPTATASSSPPPPPTDPPTPPPTSPKPAPVPQAAESPSSPSSSTTKRKCRVRGTRL